MLYLELFITGFTVGLLSFHLFDVIKGKGRREGGRERGRKGEIEQKREGERKRMEGGEREGRERREE